MKPKNLVSENSKAELNFEKLKTYKGFENITEEEAIIHIDAIKKLAGVLYGVYLNEQKKQQKDENSDS